MPRERRPCGTPAAYKRHIVAGEPPCTPCGEAMSQYNRQFRAPLAARRKAKQLLARRYPKEYQKLLLAELAELHAGQEPGAAADAAHGRRGTGGYQWHKKQGEQCCDPCRQAWREYHRLTSTCRYRARLKLAWRHPEEYERLLQAELAKGTPGAVR